MRSGVGMKLCHVHPESDTVKRLGHRREKVELLPPGPVWKADFVQERSPHSATGAIWIPQDVFNRFHGTFWRWNGETAQKPESELLLQFQGGQIEGIASAHSFPAAREERQGEREQNRCSDCQSNNGCFAPQGRSTVVHDL